MFVQLYDIYMCMFACIYRRTGEHWRSEDVLENRPPNISLLDDLMEEFFKLLLSKRRTRQLSSDSSLDTSPEPKKLRECDNPNSSEEERDEEGDDIILSALNMTEVLQKPLQDILKKLEKLDAIEQAVNNLGKSFEKLEGRIHTLEDSYASTKRDVEDLKESLNANEIDKKSTAERIQKLEDDTKSSLAALQKENDELRANFKLIEDKNLYLEAYSRRENIKFENIPEEETDKEDTETVLRTFLETELGFGDAANVEIQRVHRLGKKRGESPRPILARFLRYKDCGKLFTLGHRLRGTNYKMYQDLPFEIVERRRVQMETFKKARRNNIPAAFSKAQPDKLYIRGKLWPFGMPLEL